jgi:valyl-tRNA synthetase
MNNYYVYQHKNPKTGEIFYIGHGKDVYCKDGYLRYTRATKYTSGRNYIWKSIFDRYGAPIVEYIQKDLTKKQALDLEIELTLKLKPIANIDVGNNHSDVSRVNMSIAKDYRKIKVEQFTLDGTFINKYPSLRGASRQTGVNIGNISKCCRSLKNKAGGFIWKFAE